LPTFDYIVVGAGSAGCVLANRLSAAGATVLLLEAGGSDDHLLLHMPLGFLKAFRNPRFGWGYWSEPEPTLNGRKLPVPRGRMLGGTSNLNGMFYMRGHSADFETWRDLGCEGWGYADVLPYFKRMETSWRGENAYHGADGPLSVVPIDTRKLLHDRLMATAAPAGFATTEDIHGDVQEGFARGEVTITRKGRRASTSQAYLYPVKHRPNLKIQANALATRIVLENGRARGIEYTHRNQELRADAGHEVIVCGGTYNSPQLLMLSGIGPAEELEAHGIRVQVDLPGVGRNLSEHARVPVEFEAKEPVTFLNELRLDRIARSVIQWSLFGTGMCATQINSCNVVIRTLPALRQPDIQLMCNPVRMDAKLWFPGFGAAQEHRLTADIVLLHPESRGTVTLRSSNPLDAPRIRFNLFSHASELETARRGLETARRIYRTEPQASLTGREVAPGESEPLEAYIRTSASTTQHPVGTCKMGIDALAVVDPQLRVRGVEGLRVADASIMPTITGGNTNAPVIMIGEKASDLVLTGRTPLRR
jgi:choline dehydrogenase